MASTPIAVGTTNTTPGSIQVGQTDRLGKPWKISQKGIDFIVSYEKLRTEIYLDQIGLQTIGIGHRLTEVEKNNGTF